MNSKDLLQLYNGQLQEFELAKKNYTDLQQAVYRDIPFDLFPDFVTQKMFIL